VTSEERIKGILSFLHAVAHERQQRRADPALAARAQEIREYQANRFRRTYQDLLSSPATRMAVHFFLDELYGSQDFLQRDAQFERIVPTIVRLFSADVAQTVSLLAELHALSETLDSRMAQCMPEGLPLNAITYAQAWRQVGEPHLRERQIACVGLIGQSLVRYTTHPALGHALRLMRLPARAAGLKDLQAFLERGFETFGGLSNPQAFIDVIQERERHLAQKLYSVA
jgi:hypothetical protein